MQTSRNQSKHELRCICAHEPLLAMYGLDERGKLYIHIKIYKSNRLFGELVITEGKIEIHCRECFRWHKIRIRPQGAQLEDSRRPPFLGTGR